jgi:hypothetical protein
LQGTVQKLGAHWRVSIQMFDATTQKVMLSEKHDFDLDNVFEMQDEIGRRVAESLHSRFPSAVPKSRDRYSSDPDAYNEYMAGLHESVSDEQDTLRSAEHLSSAVERDPEFALAHALVSFVSMNIHFHFDPQRTWLQRAEDHCRLALSLDPMLPEGHLARAWILWSPAKNFQHAEAIVALEHHTWYNIACVYAVLGDTDKAMAWLERSVDTGFPCWPLVRIDPHLEILRAEPAFIRLVADLEQTYAALKIQRL